MLTNATIYWLTEHRPPPPTSTESNRWQPSLASGPLATPLGVAAFAEDIAIRRYGEQMLQHRPLVGFRPRGHFAALEAPDLFAGDVRTFFRGLRNASRSSM